MFSYKEILKQDGLGVRSEGLTPRPGYDIEEYKLVSRKLAPEYVGTEYRRSIVPLREFIKSRQDSKEIIAEDPDVVVF